MHATLKVSVVGMVWCLLVPRLAAQAPPPVEAGSRVRVWLAGPDSRRVTGEVVGVGSDALSLAPGHGRDTAAVAFRSISRLELSRGRRSVGSGMLLGGVIGAGLGAAGALAWAASSCFKSSTSTGGNCPTGGTAAGIVIGGGAVGAAVGALVRPERWVRVGWSGVRASIGPGAARVEIGF
jgi:hypothetical protein